MSKRKRPTLGQLMAALNYWPGQHLLPRVVRFLARHRAKAAFRRIGRLLRKQGLRQERRAAARFLRQRAEAAKASAGPGAPKRIRHRTPWNRRHR